MLQSFLQKTKLITNYFLKKIKLHQIIPKNPCNK